MDSSTNSTSIYTNPITLSDDPADFAEAVMPRPTEIRGMQREIRDPMLTRASEQRHPSLSAVEIAKKARIDEEHAQASIKVIQSELAEHIANKPPLHEAQEHTSHAPDIQALAELSQLSTTLNKAGEPGVTQFLAGIDRQKIKTAAYTVAGGALAFLPAAAEAVLEAKGIPAHGQVTSALKAVPSIVMGATIADKFGSSESRAKKLATGAALGVIGSQAIGYASEQVNKPGFEQAANLADDGAFLGFGALRYATNTLRSFTKR